MDNQDQRKAGPSGLERHGVHPCQKCGWPFPNPHPSAKHRRAHKRICGTIGGYKLIESGEHLHSTVSDDEHCSDEDRKTPSPKFEKRRSNEFGRSGVGERSNRSEHEVFSDAVTELPDAGFSPVNEELLEDARVSDKNSENMEGDPDTSRQLDTNETTGRVQPPSKHTEMSHMHNPEVLQTETNILGHAMPAEDITPSHYTDLPVISSNRAEELPVGHGSTINSAGDLLHVKSQTPTNSREEDGKSNVGDQEMLPSMVHFELKKNGAEGNDETEIDEILSDVSMTLTRTPSNASGDARQLQVKCQKVSDSSTADKDVKSRQEHGKLNSDQYVEVLDNTVQTGSDSSLDKDIVSLDNSIDGAKGEEVNVDFHVLSVTNIVPAVYHPEVMIEEFKDLSALKSNLPVTLDSGEVIEPLSDSKVGEGNLVEGEKGEGHEDLHVVSFANTVPAVDLPEKMIEDYNDHGALKSNHPVNLDSVEVIEPLCGDSKDIGQGNKVDDVTEEGNRYVHVLSIANIVPAIALTEVKTEDFRDHGASKSNPPVSLDSEVIKHAMTDSKDASYDENSHFHSNNSREISHESSTKLHPLEGKFKEKDGGIGPFLVPIATLPVEGEADTSALNVGSQNLVPSAVGAPPKIIPNRKIVTKSSVEVQQPHDSHNDSSVDTLPDSTTVGLSLGISADDEVTCITGASGGDDFSNLEKDVKTEDNREDGQESREGYEEEHSINLKGSSRSGDGLSGDMSDQTVDLLGIINIDDHEKFGIQVSDLSGNESRNVAMCDKHEINTEMILASAYDLPESKVEDWKDITVKNLQETDTIFNFASDPSEVASDANKLGGESLAQAGSENPHDEDSRDVMAEPKIKIITIADVDMDITSAACEGAKSYHCSNAEVSHRKPETTPEVLPEESDITTKSLSTVDNNHRRIAGLSPSGISTESVQEEGDKNLAKQLSEVPAVDVAVDSCSQTDSLEGIWGSVSVVSTQSDALTAVDAEALPMVASEAPVQSEKVNLQKPKATSEGQYPEKSDVFEPPSFQTLVEAGDGSEQRASSDMELTQDTRPKSEALQAGWFPTLTNVVNESKGRKKNEEIIAKVTNWSTGKQHTNLKSLLGEASVETQQKSPDQNKTSIAEKREKTTGKSNEPSGTTVGSILGPEALTNQVAKKEMGKPWNSPARYLPENKKEKRKVKGRPYWIPFVCCSSVN